MVAVLFHSDHIIDTDMGFREETTTHSGGIQHHLGMDLLHGASTAFDINTLMYNFLSVMARCSETSELLEDVTDGKRFLLSQRAQAQDGCVAFAAKLTAETGKTWQGFVRVYHPDNPTST